MQGVLEMIFWQAKQNCCNPDSLSDVYTT